MQIHLVLAHAQQFHIRQRHDAERLVDFKHIDLFLGDACMGQSFGDGQRRRGGEFRGFLRGVAPAEDFGEGFEVVGFEEGFRDEDEGGGAVGKRGGVWGGDGAGAVGYERRTHALQFLLVEGHGDFFILVDDRGGFAFRAGDFDGADFLFEGAGGGGGLGFLDGTDGVGVLVFSGDGVVFGAFFALEAHVLGGVSVGEAVLQEPVDEGVVAVF